MTDQERYDYLEEYAKRVKDEVEKTKFTVGDWITTTDIGSQGAPYEVIVIETPFILVRRKGETSTLTFDSRNTTFMKLSAAYVEAFVDSNYPTNACGVFWGR